MRTLLRTTLLTLVVFFIATTAHAATLTLLPSDNPMVVGLNTDLAVRAFLTNDDGTTGSADNVTWSVDGTIGRVTTSGVFTAEKNGSGTVVATRDGQEVRLAVRVNDDGAPIPACSTIGAWWWILILAGISLAQLVFYFWLGDRRTFFWWFVPTLLTLVSVLFWNAKHCENGQLWVPALFIIIGGLLGLFYRNLLAPRDPAPLPPTNRPIGPTT